MNFLKIFIFILFLNTTCAYAQHLYRPTSTPTQALTDNKLHIYLCGTGAPQVSMQVVRKPACLAVIADNQFFLIDAGDGAVQTLSAMGLPYLDIQTIFLTHVHSDHISGLGELMNGTWHSGRNKSMTVYGPYGVKEVLRGFRTAYRLDVLFRAIGGAGLLNPDLAFAKPIEISTDNKGKVVYTNKNLQITAFTVDHLPVFPAFGYQLNYKGCKIVVSGDTSVTASLAEHAKNADLLINEALSHPLYQESINIEAKNNPEILAHANQIKSYHSDSFELAKMAKQSAVKNLVLTHLLPVIPTTEEVKKSFKAGMDQYYDGPITVADDRDEIVIEADNNQCKITYLPAKQPDMSVSKVTN